MDRIGGEAWSLLVPVVHHFLATAMLHLEKQGYAPQLDYAPISVEIVKALEVQLAGVFAAFAQSIEGRISSHDEDDQSGNATRNAVYLTLSYRPDKLFISR